MTGINAAMTDRTGMTAIRTGVVHQRQQIQQMSGICERQREAKEGNLWNKTASEVGISLGICRRILHDALHARRLCQQSVPRISAPGEKETRMSISCELVNMADKDNC
jgi:hypothetical protein